MNNYWIDFSQAFLSAAKTGENTADYITKAEELNPESLLKALSTDHERKAFWINLYNAFNLHLLQGQSLDEFSLMDKWRHFRTKKLFIGHVGLPLDQMEHGILRKGKAWWGLGYWPQLRPGKFVKQAMISHLDPRIHFTLNCGSASCPPIRYYEPNALEEQLDIATEAYLMDTVTIDRANNMVYVPTLLAGYRGDFGGKTGIKFFLEKYLKTSLALQTKVQFYKIKNS